MDMWHVIILENLGSRNWAKRRDLSFFQAGLRIGKEIS